MTARDQLTQLGYTIAPATHGDDGMVTVYSVAFEDLLATYVRVDDRDGWQGLLDTHDERVAQRDETPEETAERWARAR
jgi:hypothetical protein